MEKESKTMGYPLARQDVIFIQESNVLEQVHYKRIMRI